MAASLVIVVAIIFFCRPISLLLFLLWSICMHVEILLQGGNHLITINRWWIGSRWICTPSDTHKGHCNSKSQRLRLHCCNNHGFLIICYHLPLEAGELPLPLEGQLLFRNVAGNEVLFKGKEGECMVAASELCGCSCIRPQGCFLQFRLCLACPWAWLLSQRRSRLSHALRTASSHFDPRACHLDLWVALCILPFAWRWPWSLDKFTTGAWREMASPPLFITTPKHLGSNHHHFSSICLVQQSHCALQWSWWWQTRCLPLLSPMIRLGAPDNLMVVLCKMCPDNM